MGVMVIACFGFFTYCYFSQSAIYEDQTCHSPFQCVAKHVLDAIRGDITTVLGAFVAWSFPAVVVWEDMWWNFLLQPLITGIIIDSFNQLRSRAADSEKAMEERCFISEIERFKFDGFPGEWEQRRGGKYVWNYFHFIEWLQRQDPADLSTPQLTVLACLKEDKTDFLPLGVFAARQRQELQEPTVDQDVLNVLKSFMAESRGEWHRLEQRVTTLGMRRQPRQGGQGAEQEEP
ncbi:hypothetical protein T484DRAFT_1765340 [Baffinella frigidus]|nr:hypothetical protein T484DRAFT_1765340 [Cryptophyta sp. CCMP2293]